MNFCGETGLTPTLSTAITMHGPGVTMMMLHAAMAIVTGVSKNVLCVCADTAPLLSNPAAAVAALDVDQTYEFPYGATLPALYAQVASRYLHEYGLEDGIFAPVVIQSQRWAASHQYAARRNLGEITLAQVMDSPMIASPLRLLDCAKWGPAGTGGAFVVTSAERARDLVRTPIYLLGAGSAITHETFSERIGLRHCSYDLGELPNLLRTGTAEAGRRAFQMAEVGPSDIDILETGTNFSFVRYLILEDLGFCDRGGAPEMVMSGAGEPGSRLPIDTNGGWLSFGQAGVSCAMDSVIEGIRQLRGEPLGLQATSPKGDPPQTCLVQSVGGCLSSHAVIIMSTETE
jgi:acetyl-CoA acetyltransferase